MFCKCWSELEGGWKVERREERIRGMITGCEVGEISRFVLRKGYFVYY